MGVGETTIDPSAHARTILTACAGIGSQGWAAARDSSLVSVGRVAGYRQRFRHPGKAAEPVSREARGGTMTLRRAVEATRPPKGLLWRTSEHSESYWFRQET